MRMTQHYIVEQGHLRRESLKIGQHAIAGAESPIIVAAAIIEPREISAAHEDRQSGTNVNGVELERGRFLSLGCTGGNF